MSDENPPPNLAPPSSGGTLGPSERGAILRPLHTHREVKLYPLLETEIDTLSHLSRDQRLWTSIASAAATLLAGCIWDALLVTDAPTSPRSWWTMVGLALTILFALFKSNQYGRRRRDALAALVPQDDPPLWEEFIENRKGRIRTWIRSWK
jgi:hypothetical protein